MSHPPRRRSSARPLAAWILVFYVVVLVLLPSWAGATVFGIVVTPARALLAMLILLGLYEFRPLPPARPRILTVAWAAFLLAALVTTMLHLDGHSLARFFSMVVEGALLFWVARELMGDERVRMRVITALLLATVIVAVVASGLVVLGAQYNDWLARTLGHELVSAAARERFGVLRIEGPMGQPLVFSAWLVTALFLAVSFIDRKGANASKSSWLPWAAAIVLVAALVLTVSRSALILASFVPAAYVWGLGRSRPAIGLAVMGVAVSAVVVVASGTVPLPIASPTPVSTETVASPTAAAASPSAQATAGRNAVQRSGEQRVAAYRAALTTVMEQPLFGHGLLRGSDALSAVAGKTNYIDNMYLQVAVEQGLVGLAALVGLLAGVLGLAYERRRAAHGLGLLGALCAFLLMGVVASLFSFTQMYALFWVVAAAATAPSWPASRRPAAANVS